LLEHYRFVGVSEPGVNAIVFPELSDGQKRYVQRGDDAHVMDGEPESLPTVVSAYHGQVSNGGATVVCPIDRFDDVSAWSDVQEVLRVVMHVPCGATVDDEVNQLRWVSAAEGVGSAEECATPAL
jgi:hypothetical protein